MKHNVNFLVYDIESGGLWSHNNPIIELAIIGLDNSLTELFRYENYIKPYYGKIIDSNTPFLQNIGDAKEIEFEKYKYKNIDGGWRKELKVEAQALQANGIKMKDVEEKGIDIKQLYKDLVKIFKENKKSYQKPVLVGHNIGSFDNAFIEYIFDICESKRGNRDQSSLYNYVDNCFEDTILIARKKWGLEEVENYQLGSVAAKLGIESTDYHRAMNDTEVTKEIFIKFTQDLRNKNSSNQEQEGELIEKENFRLNFQI